MKVFDGVGGPEIDPDKVNWRRVRVDDYHFRQEPGGTNAMATAKIEFKSPFGIYLHDTPQKSLFAKEVRAYSHGCIRLKDPFDFAYALLAPQSADPQAELNPPLRRCDQRPHASRSASIFACSAGT
jgi:murein L,D-transpeptidase YcbB/YkuD